MLEKYNRFFLRKDYKKYAFSLNDEFISLIVNETEQYFRQFKYSDIKSKKSNSKLFKDFNNILISLLNPFIKTTFFVDIFENKDLVIRFSTIKPSPFPWFLSIFFSFNDVADTIIFSDNIKVEFTNSHMGVYWVPSILFIVVNGKIKRADKDNRLWIFFRNVTRHVIENIKKHSNLFKYAFKTRKYKSVY